MAKQASLTLCDEEVEFVQTVENQEEPEETTENLQMEHSTQYVLEVEPVEEPKKKNKGKGKSSSIAATKKRIMSHPFIKWLKTIWIANTTLRIMKPWLKAINEEALKVKNQKMFLVGQNISQIMKQFFIHMKDNQKSLIDCSFANFEEWCCGDGLSMMSGRLPEMVWEEDSTETLFNLYSDCIMELRRLQEAIQSDSDQEQETRPVQRKIISKASSLSRNTKSTYMSSTIAHTPEAHADASTYKESESILLPTMSRKRGLDGAAHKKDMSMKESSPFRNKAVTFESESEDEAYRPGQLFTDKPQSKSVEEESEPELTEPPMKKSKKLSRPRQSTSSESDEVPDEEAFTSMVDSLARAHSLTPSTGKISQSILIKDGEGFISFTSPGERGSMIIKFEMYPFKDCLRLEKNQYWTKRIYSSLAMVCSKNSPAYKTAMKLREQLTQQVGEVKGVNIEKKAPTGWKRS